METYYGHVRTPADAIILFEACSFDLFPRVRKRLSEKERQLIRSGPVFVWDEREAGIRRWTDGKSWSASRVSGSFLTYREMEGKRRGGSATQSSVLKLGETSESPRGSGEDQRDGPDNGPDGYRYKPNGLMKQSFSITTSAGHHLHLISYHSRLHLSTASLQQPTTDHTLRYFRAKKGLYPQSAVHDEQDFPFGACGPMAGTATCSINPHPMVSRARTTQDPKYKPFSYVWLPSALSTPPTVAVPQHNTTNTSLSPILATNGPSDSIGLPLYPRLQHQPKQHQAPSDSLLSLPGGMPGPCKQPVHSEGISSALPPFALSQGYPSLSLRILHYPPPQQQKRSSHYASIPDPRLVSPQGAASANPPVNDITRNSPHVLNQILPSYPLQLELVGTPSKSFEASGVPEIGMLGGQTSLAPLKTLAAPAFGSRSPINLHPGPCDIPKEKLAFGVEDLRALGQLDRFFL